MVFVVFDNLNSGKWESGSVGVRPMSTGLTPNSFIYIDIYFSNIMLY